MACGSAQLLADLMSGKRPAIASSDQALARYTDRPREARMILAGA
jgi:D-amino-acid dehydrogenase